MAGTSNGKMMNLTLRVWRQSGPDAQGELREYAAPGVSPDMSFLEMLDVVNEGLITRGELPIAFDHDCREGICGSCSLMIDGVAHGPHHATTTCQLHMRSFKDGDVVTIEPWRASAFPVLKDLVVNRSAFDRIIQAGGYVSVATGSAPDGNAIPVPKEGSDLAMDAAQCIGCGACVAACPNGSASLFTAAKISHLGHLPQGQAERHRRVLAMVSQMDEEGFGGCTLFGECQAACPKEISIDNITRMNRDFLVASFTAQPERAESAGI
jgi:succinate dehydrogenase / fumarate reductase iron-sulfur subunit